MREVRIPVERRRLCEAVVSVGLDSAAGTFKWKPACKIYQRREDVEHRMSYRINIWNGSHQLLNLNWLIWRILPQLCHQGTFYGSTILFDQMVQPPIKSNVVISNQISCQKQLLLMWNIVECCNPNPAGAKIDLLLWAPPKLTLFQLPKEDSRLYFTHFSLDSELNLLTVSW